MASASGRSLGSADIPIVLGMAARGDRNHDIAAWFGVNQGRIAEAKDGRYGSPPAAAGHSLPPSGAPGVKGRRLHSSVSTAIDVLADANEADQGARAKALKLLRDGMARYETSEG